jgi:hypothetical protein
MTKEELIISAAKLKQPVSEAVTEFASRQDAMAAELNRRMLMRPDLVRLIGADNHEMMENNSHNFLRFMNALFHQYQPQVLVETALWVFRSYRSHGFQTAYWPANLDTAVEILRKELSPPAFEAAYPFFEWLIVNIPSFVNIGDEIMLKEPSHDVGS